jgi:hypothetical protein
LSSYESDGKEEDANKSKFEKWVSMAIGALDLNCIFRVFLELRPRSSF